MSLLTLFQKTFKEHDCFIREIGFWEDNGYTSYDICIEVADEVLYCCHVGPKGIDGIRMGPPGARKRIKGL